jgi:hypothetical protein
MKRFITYAAGALALGAVALAAAGPAQVSGSGRPAEAVALASAGVVLDSFDVPATTSATTGGQAVITAGGAPQGFAATASCQTSAMLASGRYLKVVGVDWAHGRLQVRNLLPVCSGVVAKTSGAGYAFEVGSKVQGSAGRPNLPRFPQSRVAVTPWRDLHRGAGQVTTVLFPAVRDQCTQTDVAVFTQGTQSSWPARLTHLGQPQPRGFAYYVGNGKGCNGAPALSVTSRCPTDCTGVATVAGRVTNRNHYAAVEVRMVIGDRPTSATRVPAGKATSLSARVGDGGKYRYQYRVGLGRWTAWADLTRDRVVECPPAPHLSLALDCPCGGQVKGLVVDHNGTRYAHRVTVTGASGAKVVTVPAKRDGTLSGLSWPRGRTVVVSVQSYLGSRAVGPAVRTPLTVG